MNHPTGSPTWLRRHRAAFLHRVVQQRQRRCGAVRADALEPHRLENAADASALGWVGASDRSTMPNGTPSLSEAARLTSSHMRVTPNAVRLMALASWPKSSIGWFLNGRQHDARPLTPDVEHALRLTDAVKGAAMNGLSSTALQKTTSMAQPSPPTRRSERRLSQTIGPSRATASMLMPARVVPTLTEAHTRSVVLRAWGIEASRARSRASSFMHKAEIAAEKVDALPGAPRDRAPARTRCSPGFPSASATIAIGVTEIRLLMMGMPYSCSISIPHAHEARRRPCRSCRRRVTRRHRSIRMRAVVQADAQWHGADVEVLHLHHADGLDKISCEEISCMAGRTVRCDAVFEDVPVLRTDAQPHLLPLGLQASLDLVEGQRRFFARSTIMIIAKNSRSVV